MPKVDAALPQTVAEVMTQAYEKAVLPDGSVVLSTVPSVSEIYTTLGAEWEPNLYGEGIGGWDGGRGGIAKLQNHHTAVQQWAKKLIARPPEEPLTQTELDSMPGILLKADKHIGKNGTKAFHAVLRQFLKDGKTYPKEDILDGLEKAYLEWDSKLGPKVWAVARKWLEKEGVK